ncbi:MAG: hypothetical protein II875_07260 [Clostridia bacterium]|nr:hypothetical protein [Clostridia bacterium]
MNATKEMIREKAELAQKRLSEFHLRRIANVDGDILLISTAYPGVWLEHAFDGLCYARLHADDPEKRLIAENQMRLFLNNQKPDGHIPYRVLDLSLSNRNYAGAEELGFRQLQECVSLGQLCLGTYELTGNEAFLRDAFKAVKGWVKWQKENRETRGLGLIETFCVYDTGHDNSMRLAGLPNACPDAEGKEYEHNGILPLLSPDVNAVYYGNLTALKIMAEKLNEPEAAARYEKEAAQFKERMFELLYDEKDAFFYDVDANNEKRRLRTVSVTNVFSEKLLTQDEFDLIYDRHFKDPDGFMAPYPFPSIALGDTRGKPHAEKNCWGYYSQALTALRGQLWMDRYGRSADYDALLEKWVDVYASQDEILFSQEIDPYTGRPTDCSRWYSSAMLTYLYAVKRLGLL